MLANYRMILILAAIALLIAAIASARSSPPPISTAENCIAAAAGDAPVIAAPAAKDPTVYITKKGKKFHRAGCRYLSKSKIAIKRSQAIKKGYKPCKVCKP